MATLKTHKDASVALHETVADSGIEALKKVGQTLKDVGEQLSDGQDEVRPGQLVVGALLGIAEAHAKFRDGTLDAVSKALKTIRKA
jgi:hypothetical protein